MLLDDLAPLVDQKLIALSPAAILDDGRLALITNYHSLTDDNARRNYVATLVRIIPQFHSIRRFDFFLHNHPDIYLPAIPPGRRLPGKLAVECLERWPQHMRSDMFCINNEFMRHIEAIGTFLANDTTRRLVMECPDFRTSSLLNSMCWRRLYVDDIVNFVRAKPYLLNTMPLRGSGLSMVAELYPRMRDVLRELGDRPIPCWATLGFALDAGDIDIVRRTIPVLKHDTADYLGLALRGKDIKQLHRMAKTLCENCTDMQQESIYHALVRHIFHLLADNLWTFACMLPCAPRQFCKTDAAKTDLSTMPRCCLLQDAMKTTKAPDGTAAYEELVVALRDCELIVQRDCPLDPHAARDVLRNYLSVHRASSGTQTPLSPLADRLWKTMFADDESMATRLRLAIELRGCGGRALANSDYVPSHLVGLTLAKRAYEQWTPLLEHPVLPEVQQRLLDHAQQLEDQAVAGDKRPAAT